MAGSGKPAQPSAQAPAQRRAALAASPASTAWAGEASAEAGSEAEVGGSLVGSRSGLGLMGSSGVRASAAIVSTGLVPGLGLVVRPPAPTALESLCDDSNPPGAAEAGGTLGETGAGSTVVADGVGLGSSPHATRSPAMTRETIDLMDGSYKKGSGSHSQSIASP